MDRSCLHNYKQVIYNYVECLYGGTFRTYTYIHSYIGIGEGMSHERKHFQGILTFVKFYSERMTTTFMSVTLMTVTLLSVTLMTVTLSVTTTLMSVTLMLLSAQM